MSRLLTRDRPYIYVITDGTATDASFADAVGKIVHQITDAVDEKVSMVQIREKQLTARHLFHLARICADITRGSATKLLINDRVDIAAASGADGVHLTAHSISTDVVRRAFGSELIIGVSAHTLAEVEAAARQQADFAVFGPVFETPGKGPAVGLELSKSICSAVAPFPVFGLGGIDPSNCADVILAGAAGVSGIRSFGNRAELRSLRESLNSVSR